MSFLMFNHYSIFFASRVNSLIPLVPLTYSMLCRRCGLCSLRNRKISIVWGGGGEGGRECFQDALKTNFTTKCLRTFITHCSLTHCNKNHTCRLWAPIVTLNLVRSETKKLEDQSEVVSYLGGERGEIFPRRLKIEFHCLVSQHFCRPL